LLAGLSINPRNPEAWELWVRDHRDSHDRIRQAILTDTGIKLTDYPIDPLTKQNLGDWLQYNSQLHAEMNGVLGLQSVDLLDVDFENEPQKIAWINSHDYEHRSAEQALGI
jgi:hypothetical protein